MEKKDTEARWTTLIHNGPLFAPAYKPLPYDVHFYYDGQVVKLSMKGEEVAGLYAKLLDSDYVTNKTFNENFFNDWHEVGWFYFTTFKM